MNKYLRTLSSCTLSAALFTNLIPVQVYANEDNYPTEKNETVYCVLKEDGSPSSTIVSNWIHDEDGIQNMKETLDLRNVTSTKGSVKPSVNGNTYTWNTSDVDVHYQGETDKKLPVRVHATYYLDGKEVNAKDLEGKSGHLKCVISLNPTITKKVKCGNKEVSIYPTYLCGGALVLNSKSAKNVTVTQGQVIQEGDSSIISFVAVPGLRNSLEQMELDKVIDTYDIQDKIVIEGDVKKCEVKTMIMGMTNGFNLDTLNSIDTLSELTGGINELVNASNQIADGSKELYNGTSELIEKSAPLTSSYPKIQQLAVASEQLDDGAILVKQGVINYVNGSREINAGINALNEGASQMAGSSEIAKGMKQLSEALEKYDQSLQQTQAALQNNETFNNLNGLIGTSKSQLAGMSKVIESAQGSLSELSAAVSAFQQLTATLKNACADIQNANGTLEADNQTIEQYNSIIEGTKSTLSVSMGILQNALGDEGLSDADKAAIQGQISELSGQYNMLCELSALSTVDLSSLSQNLSTIQGILSQLDLGAIQGKLSALASMLEQANGTLDGMAQNVQSAQTDLAQLNLAGMVAQLEQYASQFSQNGKTLSGYVDNLDKGIGQMRGAISQINDGSKELNEYDQSLIDGVVALQNGTKELKSNKNSFNEMADGLQQLSSAFTQLNNGAKTLSDGCQKFNAEGMQTLKNKVDLT
ncbi:MAG: hypothetical protein KBT48_02160, partial [Firmicutes bacterium]|nr:hypothetical protein [Bacillota bacterium]